MPAWLAGTRPRTSGKVYLSIDLDGLDPAFAPGVSHHEPGGLATREVLALVQQLDGDLVAADVVEYNPRPRHRRAHGDGGREDREGSGGTDDGGGRRDPRRSPYCLTQVGRRSWVTPATSSRTISP